MNQNDAQTQHDKNKQTNQDKRFIATIRIYHSYYYSYYLQVSIQLCDSFNNPYYVSIIILLQDVVQSFDYIQRIEKKKIKQI